MLNDFINQYTGKKDVGDTPQNIRECVGLVETWFDTLLEPHVWGNAKDLYANAGAGYTKGTSWPAPADSAGVMDGSWGDGAGHTWISLGDGRVFEQNNPVGSTPHVSNYGSARPKGYIGWILPDNFKVNATNVGGEDMVDEKTLNTLYASILERPRSNGEGADYIGKPTNWVIDQIAGSPERAQVGARYQKIAELEAAASNPITDENWSKFKELVQQATK